MKIVVIAFIVAAMNGCGGVSTTTDESMVMQSDKMAAVADVQSSGEMMQVADNDQSSTTIDVSTNALEKKQVRTGNLTFRVKDVNQTYDNINKALTAYGAYIENENQYSYSDRLNYSITVRIPAAKFDGFLEFISKEAAYMENKSVNVEDVTARYYDLETRIKNKKALEVRYLDLLSKSTNVRDILDIENQLNTVRTDIENMEGQFNYLKKQVSMSTMNLQFYELLPYSVDEGSKQTMLERLSQSFTNGWQWFLSFLVGIVSLWPFLLFTPVVVFLWKKWKNR